MRTDKRLHFLVVDDEPAIAEDAFFDRIKVVPIFSYADVTERLGAGADLDPVDIFCFDLNLRRSHNNRFETEDIYWVISGSTLPYGPLLALPFIQPGRMGVFVPYSAHWKDPAVTQNGFVLTSLALLLSAFKATPLTLRDVNKILLGDEQFPTHTMGAVRYGLEKWREGLYHEDVVISGVMECLESLEQLKVDVTRTGVGLKNLSIGEQALMICVERADFREEFLLESVFADILQNCAIIGLPQLTAIADQLKLMVKKLGDRLEVQLPCLEQMTVILARFGEQKGRSLKKEKERVVEEINKIFEEDHKKLPPPGWDGLIIRLLVGMAWVDEWYVRCGGKDPQDPSSKGAKRMVAASSLRRMGHTMQTSMKMSVRKRLGLPNAPQDYKRLFFGNNFEEGKKTRWGRPFRSDVEDEADQASLHTYDNALLYPIERIFLREYATSLGWDNPSDLPAWLRAPGE
ncbi:MAG TPA: hypothetical protein PKW35_00895 [Nannocystaceae bacterium]|nr:hypothetical protein [Nannocystaceae bacterium]